jgi:hypothetical protein
MLAAASLLALAGVTGCSSEAVDEAASAASSVAASAAESVRASASAEVSASVAASASAAASASPGASGQVCTDFATVQSSLDALTGTNIVQEGTNTLKERFATFQSDVASLVDSAQADFAGQTTAVKASLAALEAALTGLADSPSVADAAMIKPALEAVKTSTEELVAAVQGAC